MLSCSGHSFSNLCVPCRSELASFARRLTGNEARAEDIVQDAYVKAIKAWPRWGPGDKDPSQAARAWMYRIVANLYANDHRDRRIRDRILDTRRAQIVGAMYGDVFDDTGDDLCVLPLSSITISPEVLVALGRLQARRRDIVERFYFRCQSCEEIASDLKMPSSTVCTQLRRARTRLAPLLERFAVLNYNLAARVSPQPEPPEREKPKPHRVKAVMRYRRARPLSVVQVTPDQAAAG